MGVGFGYYRCRSCIITTTLLPTEQSMKLIVSHGVPHVLFLNVNYNFTDCSVASRVVVMVQWLAHPTSNQVDAGSIPTHGIYMFYIQKDQLVVRCHYLYTHYYIKVRPVIRAAKTSNLSRDIAAKLVLKMLRALRPTHNLSRND